ncbi:MAG: hypothetical protein KDC38_08125 [Planctomycetes bacterium]|nr:hypothetical protein [Planctomycetota bacterium]
MRMVSILVVLVALLPRVGSAEEAESTSRFEITIDERTKVGDTETEKQSRFEVDVHVLAEPRGALRLILVVDDAGDQRPYDIPIGEARRDAKGRWIFPLESPRGRLVSLIAPLLVSREIPRDRVEAYASGSERTLWPRTGLRRKVDVEYRSDAHPDDASSVLYERKLAAGVEESAGSMTSTVDECTQTYRLDGDTFRVLEVVEVLRSRKGTERRTVETRREVRARELKHQPVDSTQRHALISGLAALEPLARQAFPGNFGDAPGGDDALEALEQFVAQHDDSPYLPAVPWLRRTLLSKARGGSDPLVRFAQLEGAPAPSFDLRGIDGKPYALGELQGKVILLFFYSFT